MALAAFRDERQESNPTITCEDFFVEFGDYLENQVSPEVRDRKSTRLNSSHLVISYAVICLKKKTSELQSPCNLVCRLLLEKKNHMVIDGEFDIIESTASQLSNDDIPNRVLAACPQLLAHHT